LSVETRTWACVQLNGANLCIRLIFLLMTSIIIEKFINSSLCVSMYKLMCYQHHKHMPWVALSCNSLSWVQM
jgi:hypothetical protein